MNSDFVAKYLELVQISVSKIDTTLLVEPGKEWGNESTLHYELFRDDAASYLTSRYSTLSRRTKRKRQNTLRQCFVNIYSLRY